MLAVFDGGGGGTRTHKALAGSTFQEWCSAIERLLR